MSAAILVIEDDPEIGGLIVARMREKGHTVERAANGPDGLARFEQGAFDLLILDLMLPGLDGLDVCRRIRANDSHTPILMLTARAEKHEVVQGLEVGADDYLTKPFHGAELLARVQALLRRSALAPEPAEAAAPIVCGPVRIEPDKHKVEVAGRAVALTAKEFDLLLLFCRNPGRAFDRGQLLDAVWGREFAGYDHTVNTHINRLRGKIEPDADAPRYIQTVWGVGYRFAEPDEIAE